MSYRASTSKRVHLLYILQYRHFHRGHCRQPQPLPPTSTNKMLDRGWPTNESASSQRPKRRSFQPRPIRDELWGRDDIDRFWFDQILMDNENLVKIKLGKNVNFFWKVVEILFIKWRKSYLLLFSEIFREK